MTEDNHTSCSNINADAFLPFSLDYMPKELKIRAKVELFEDENKTDEKLKLLRSLLKEVENFCCQDDDLFLLAFLRARKFDVKRACDLIKGFYTTLGKHGHIFYTLKFAYLKEIMEENSKGVLPYRDKDGSIIIFFHFTHWDFKVRSAEEQIACISIGLMQALLYPATQVAGAKLIVDFKDFSMAHLLHISPSSILFFLRMLQNSIPIRMQGFHIVNENYLFSYLWSFSKLFMTKKFRERIHVHGKDMQSLYKFFDPSILPAEIGGEQPPFDNTPWRETMEKSADYIQHVLSYGYKKYLTKYKNSAGSNVTAVNH